MRTLVHLEERQMRALRRRASRAGRSLAAEIRAAVDRHLEEPPPPPLQGFVGCGKGPEGDDASRRADEIVKGLLG